LAVVFSGKGVNSRTKKQKAQALSCPRNILAESAPKGGKKSKTIKEAKSPLDF